MLLSVQFFQKTIKWWTTIIARNLVLSSFAQLYEIYPHCYRYFLHFYCCMISHSVNIPHFIWKRKLWRWEVYTEYTLWRSWVACRYSWVTGMVKPWEQGDCSRDSVRHERNFYWSSSVEWKRGTIFEFYWRCHKQVLCMIDSETSGGLDCGWMPLVLAWVCRGAIEMGRKSTFGQSE